MRAAEEFLNAEKAALRAGIFCSVGKGGHSEKREKKECTDREAARRLVLE